MEDFYGKCERKTQGNRQRQGRLLQNRNHEY